MKNILSDLLDSIWTFKKYYAKDILFLVLGITCGAVLAAVLLSLR